MKMTFSLLAASLALAAAADEPAAAKWADCLVEYKEQIVKDGDTVVLIGDSITEQGFCNKWGYYHLLTNAMPRVRFVPLGFGGFQVKSWSDLERDSLSNTNLCTWYRNHGWNLKEVFDGHIDVIVVFLGMNDILQPSVSEDEASLGKWLFDYATFVKNLRERCRPREIVLATITPLTADMTSPKNRVRRRLNNRIRMFVESSYAGGSGMLSVADTGLGVSEGVDDTRLANSGYRLVPDFVHPDALGHKIIARELCMAFGCEEEADRLSAEVSEELVEKSQCGDGGVGVWLEPVRTCRPGDDEFVYLVHYRVNSVGFAAAEARVVLPEGWTADELAMVADEGMFFVRGRPRSLVTTIRVDAGPAGRAVLNIPAPWKVCDESGEWKLYTATQDYTGGLAPGSIDPYQLYFGARTNTLRCVRRVKSEKARDVKAVFSHQTFSATLDLSLSLNGRAVFADSLNRNGKNRSEKVVRLEEGWNDVEVKCVNRDWQRQFSFDFEPLAGDDLSGLEYGIR